MQSRLFLGRYEAIRLLGEGGMGRVYLARQTDLGRQVVVKVMHDHIAADAKFRDRFQRETLVMARFQHPCCVTLFDASLNDPNGPCIVMEYVKGVNLEALLQKNGKFTPARVARIILQLCDVLQAAHEAGIIHRDLKPANLMVIDPDTPKERIKVMDFGLAKLSEDAPSAPVTDTAVDFAVGTPGYIAPEQIRGEAMDQRGDIYSIGAMMYELMTGRLPFIGASSMDVLLAHATEAPPRFAEIGLADWAPAEVEALVLSCLAKDPADRPQSAKELARRLELALGLRKAPSETNNLPIRSADRETPPNLAPSSRSSTKGIPEGLTESDVVPLTATSSAAPAAAGSNAARASHQKMSTTAATMSVATTPRGTPAAPRPADLVKDASALPFQLDAWMPERIAIVKLKGFVNDFGGDFIESTQGLVRLRLGRSSSISGAFNWLGMSRRNAPIDVELHLQKIDAKQDNRLNIHVLFRPLHPSLLDDRQWRDRCTQLFIELRAYLMGAAN